MKKYEEYLKDINALRDDVRQRLFDCGHDVTLKHARYIVFDMGDWVEKVPIKYIQYDRSFGDFVCNTDENNYDYLFDHLTIDGYLILLNILENLEENEL